MTGAKAPLKPKHIWAIRQHLKSLGSVRDLAMFNIALDAKLRGCDLVKLRLADVAHGGAVRQRSTIVQQKTGRPVPFEITEPAREALMQWLDLRAGGRMIGCSQAEAMPAGISARVSTPASSTAGFE